MMSSSYRKIQIITIVLLTVKLCSPVYGAVILSEILSAVESSHPEFVCVQGGSDSSHESPESSPHVLQCHGLDQPSLIASCLTIVYSPVILTLDLSFKCAMLPGFGPPVYIPPEYLV
jgi:hypothetical protein